MAARSRAAEIVGTRVRDARTGAGVSTRQAAKLADIDFTNYQRVERGTANPTVTTLVKISHALGVDPGSLLAGLVITDLAEDERGGAHSEAEFQAWLAEKRRS